MKVKICGLRRLEDIEYVNTLKPDFIGFILTEGFKRSIDEQTATLLRSKLDSNIRAVGVFVNDDVSKINSYVQKGIIDIVQLHGDESAEYCNMINAPVIKCFQYNKEKHYDSVDKYDIEYLMFDSGTGSAKTFDWHTIPRTDKKFFLAGGLNEENLLDAIQIVNPYAVDISSGVEVDGVKNFDKIKKVMEIVRYEKG